MKPLPRINQSCAGIYRLVTSNFDNNILTAAVKLKIFDALSEPISAGEVSEKIGSHQRNTELLLNALAGMKIISKNSGRFLNTKESEAYLVSDSPVYLAGFFQYIRQWYEQLGPNLENLVKNGPPAENTTMTDGTMWAEYTRLSAAYQYSGPAQRIAEIVMSQPEFPKMKKMIDLGGGAGFFAQAIVGAHPSMTGVIFEQAPVASVAQEFLIQYEAESRISVMQGDYQADPIGSGYDLIFASATLNFYLGCFPELFAKINTALNPGGIFMTYQDGITDERTQPVEHIVGFLAAELSGMDVAIPRGLIAESMLQAGFQTVRSFTLQTDYGGFDIDIGRKGRNV